MPICHADKEIPLSNQDRARFGKALSLNNLNRFDEAVVILRTLNDYYPFNKDILLEYNRAAGIGQNYQEVANAFTRVLQKKGFDEELMHILATLYEGNQQFVKAYHFFDELSKQTGKSNYRLKAGDNAFWAKDYLNAVQFYELLKDKLNPEQQNYYYYALRDSGQTQRAEKYHQKAKLFIAKTEESTDDKSAQLFLARQASWAEKYNESIELYQNLIAQYPHWLEPQLDLARVYGWKGDYAKSLAMYKQLTKQFPHKKELRLEYKAKQGFYNMHHRKAEKHYQNWLTLEPQQFEVQSDLAQVYARQKNYAKAVELLKQLHKEQPNFFQADDALSEITKQTQTVSWKTGFEFFEADSGARLNDVRYFGEWNQWDIPVKDQVKISLKNQFRRYAFSSMSSINRNNTSLQLKYIHQDDFEFYISPIFNNYSDGLNDPVYVRAGTALQLCDYMLLDFYFEQEDVIENATTLSSGLDRNVYRIKSTVYLNRRLQGNLQYEFVDYSDDNKRDMMAIDWRYNLWEFPHRLSFSYHYEQYEFAKPASAYFSPSSFHFNEIGLEWQHHLKKPKYWGMPETYYLLRYSTNFDVGDNTAHNLIAELRHDWNNRFSSHAHMSKKFYDRSNIYSENDFLFYVTYYLGVGKNSDETK